MSNPGKPRQSRPQAPSTFLNRPPPNSQDNGAGSVGAFSQGSRAPTVIGTTGVNFLRHGNEAQKANGDDGSVTHNNTYQVSTPTETKPVSKRAGNSVSVITEKATVKERGDGSEPSSNLKTASLHFERQKPDAIPAGTVLDMFFSLDSDGETAEKSEVLIDFAEDVKAVAATTDQEPLVVDSVDSQAAKELPSQDLGLLDEVTLTSDDASRKPPAKRLCPRAPSYVSSTATVIDNTQTTSHSNKSEAYPVSATGSASFHPWPGPMAHGVIPIMSHAMIVPIAIVEHLPNHAMHHTPTQSAYVPESLGSAQPLSGTVSRSKSGKNPVGGLGSSMWAREADRY